MNEKSYTELSAMKNNKSQETYVKDLYIDMLLSEIQLSVEKANLMSLIDKAIDEHDKESFYELSIEYKQLCKRFGT